jgi:hypothetical protein
MPTIFFETLHLPKDHASCHLHYCPKDNPTVLNTPFKKTYRSKVKQKTPEKEWGWGFRMG